MARTSNNLMRPVEMISSLYHKAVCSCVLIAVFLLLCQDVSARAGGAGARRKSSSTTSSGSSSSHRYSRSSDSKSSYSPKPRTTGSSYKSKSSSRKNYSRAAGYAGAAYTAGTLAGSDSSHTAGSEADSTLTAAPAAAPASPGTKAIGAGGLLIIVLIILSVLAFAVYKIIRAVSGGYKMEPLKATQIIGPMPDELNGQKVKDAFLAVQNAWQQKDLKNVRRWISDGVYQRYTVQFTMMNKLSQVNKLSNIQVKTIRLAKTITDGNYHSADIEVSFAMDDSLVSSRYPQFNESYQGEEAREYWTFIKRNDATAGKDLYKNNNCPNCGAPFENQMGEISRCSGCGTLTNNASYDWVLSEITQEEDYSPLDSIISDPRLATLTEHDSLFSIQRIEDMSSNIFMQIMDVMSGGKEKKLERFADTSTVAQILKVRQMMGAVIFDRIYLNSVSAVNYNLLFSRLNIVVQLVATYQRVVPAGTEIRMLDSDMVTQSFTIVLSRNTETLQTPAKETVYSYECSGCGAPYNDTTDDNCTYCGQPVIDLNRNWVLTDFRMG